MANSANIGIYGVKHALNSLKFLGWLERLSKIGLTFKAFKRNH